MSQRVSPFGAGIFVAVVAAGLWLGARDTNDDARDARDATLIDGPSAGVVALPARTLGGDVHALGAWHEASVVMVSSETCTYCKAAYREMARVAAGRPLRRLRVLTLEGADKGVAMLAAAHVTGATLAGPATPADESLYTFQIRGTPTFVAVDRTGRVTGTMIGYAGPRALAPWIGVMLGEREAP